MPLIGSAVAGTSAANPGSDDSQAPSCTFTLSKPTRVQVSGVDMVTATVSSYPCNGDTLPNKTVACVNMQGADGAGQCVQQNPQTFPAQVYFSPYRPGATYVSSGTGCTALFQPPYSACVSLGPESATL
ncbi:hypothetical protein [Mycolicibacterium hodleri]|nr:hypothetical protein [Mycolicibacterium hodleri]